MIRPYHPDDAQHLVDLLRLNTPQYFHPSEESDFVEYLVNHAENYFVVEENGMVIGCGGYNYADNNSTAYISWDIVHPDFQGKGIGTQLLLHRIQEIRNTMTSGTLIVRTSQMTHQFYARYGFELEKTVKDYWAPGIDMYHMRRSLHD